MNRRIVLALILTISSFHSLVYSENEILNKMISNLNSIETIEYNTDLRQFLKEQRIDTLNTAFCFFDFTSSDSLIGSKYFFSYSSGYNVFNGKAQFICEHNEKNILYSNAPSGYLVSSSWYMLNSIYVIRKVLPKLILDSTVTFSRQKDTVLNNVTCYKFNILVKDKFLNLGGILSTAKGINSNFTLLISKNNYLPKQFTTYLPNNSGFIQATYNDIKTSVVLADSLWNYDWLPKGYIRISFEDFSKGIRTTTTMKIGQQAADWTLPMVSGNTVRLTEQKSNLVLVEFWFPYCGACIQAITEINKIQKEFGIKGLKVYGIEFQKQDYDGLIEYIEKQKIEYPILYNGKQAAKDYDVTSAPTFFLINKKGKIVYASAGFIKADLVTAIKENIEKQ